MDVNKRRLLMKEPTNCLSVCDHFVGLECVYPFVGLALKGLRLGYDDYRNLSCEKLLVKEKSVSIQGISPEILSDFIL